MALSKLLPQFSQVCPSERRGVGAPLGDLPSRCGHPGMSWAPQPAGREPTTKGAQGRESRSKEGGKAGAPACAHNEAAETHTFPRGSSRGSIRRPAQRCGVMESPDRK